MDFQKTIGHEKQKAWFLRAYKNDSLAHAYVLAGPENIGKTTFALEFAEILGCDPVLDVFLHDKEQGLGIEEARLLRGSLSLTPVGARKVAIITFAERMNVAAGNCLLKLLEEPPGRCMIFLVTSNLRALLPTVISRVSRVNFARYTQEEITATLPRLGASGQQAREIALMAAGRLGLAKSLLKNPDQYDAYQAMSVLYEILAAGNSLDRLLAAGRLAGRENLEIRQFVKYAMARWTGNVEANQSLGSRLMRAWQDLNFNLNTKLLLDNLFIT